MWVYRSSIRVCQQVSSGSAHDAEIENQVEPVKLIEAKRTTGLQGVHLYTCTGAHGRIRTAGLILTKNVLCLLSYVGMRAKAGRTDGGRPVGREGFEPPQGEARLVYSQFRLSTPAPAHGADGQIRTDDRLVTKQLLYR